VPLVEVSVEHAVATPAGAAALLDPFAPRAEAAPIDGEEGMALLPRCIYIIYREREREGRREGGREGEREIE